MLGKGPESSQAGRPAVCYLRRSTDRQEQSLADQEAAIRRYAEANGFEILRLYTDDAISGTSADNRPAFQRLIAHAANDHRDFRFVLCYDVKRFGRVDSDEAGHYRFLLRKSGVEVVYTNEGFTGQDTDEIVRTIKQLQARQESKDLSKVTLRGQLTSIHAGSYLGGVPPYGYDYLYIDSVSRPIQIVRFNNKGEKLLLDPPTGKHIRCVPQGQRLTGSREDQIRLVPSAPDRVVIIRRIFADYHAGFGYRMIANRLNAEGVRSPRSREWDPTKYNGQWGLSTIRNIVVNPVYAGDTCWNRHTEGKFHRVTAKGVVERHDHGARTREPNPREDWVLLRDTHEPLVPRSLFDDIQAERLKRDEDGWGCRNPRGRGRYSYYLLSGLITCEDCGHRFHGYTHKSRACHRDPSLPRPRYYLCGGYVTKGNSVCKRRAYPQEAPESHVLMRLQARLDAFVKKGGAEILLKLMRDAIAQAGPNPKASLAEAQSEIARLKKDIDRLLENLTPLNRDFVDEKLDQIRRRLRDLHAQVDDLCARATRTPDIEAAVDVALDQLGSIRQVLAQGSIIEQKALLRGFIAGITLTPSQDRGVITWYQLPESL